MRHTLFHLYGPFSIHSYGLSIAIGLLIFIYLVKRDKRFALLNMTDAKFTKILFVSIITAILGGRILFLIENPELFLSPLDLLTFWQGGFSILGTVIAVALVIPWYLRYLHIPIVGMLDLTSIYAPLLQSISRIGCFLAGCCYGLPTTQPWGIMYTDPGSEAPLYLCLHPAQLYSSMGLMVIFAFMYFVAQRILPVPGQLTCMYIMLISMERFMVDFWRGDREELHWIFNTFSLYQYIAAGMFIISAVLFIGITLRKRTS